MGEEAAVVLGIGCCPGDSPDRGGGGLLRGVSLPGHRDTGRHPASNGHTPGKRKPLFYKWFFGE